MSFYRARTLNLCSGNSVISTIEVPTEFITFETPVKLHKGENFIRFQAQDESERPCDIPALHSTDSRNLFIAVQDITIDNSDQQ
jgi:hypothetical protein